MSRQIVPSLLSADFAQLESEIRSVEEHGVRRLHLDVMDGHFVPNLTFGPMIVQAVRRLTDAHLEVHLMMEQPSGFIRQFAEAGGETILVQQETCPHLQRDLNLIREQGVVPGVVLNPATPLHTLQEVLPDMGHLLVMTVNPGFGGQSFLETMPDKIRRAREMIDGHDIRLEVDGGIDLTTIGQARDAGADLFVVGSSIFNEADPGEAYLALSRELDVLA